MCRTWIYAVVLGPSDACATAIAVDPSTVFPPFRIAPRIMLNRDVLDTSCQIACPS